MIVLATERPIENNQNDGKCLSLGFVYTQLTYTSHVTRTRDGRIQFVFLCWWWSQVVFQKLLIIVAMIMIMSMVVILWLPSFRNHQYNHNQDNRDFDEDNLYKMMHLIFYTLMPNTTEYHYPLHWRHNDHDGVSNRQPHSCLLNRLFRRRSKKTSKFRVTGLCAGNSPGPVNSPHKGPVTRKMFPFDDVIMGIFVTDIAVASRGRHTVSNHRELFSAGCSA